MAHQAHAIPWNVLASNLKLIIAPDLPREQPANFYLRGKSRQAKELAYFAEAFARNVAEHTRSERKKYTESYGEPEPDDLLLSDEIIRKIGSTISRIRHRLQTKRVGHGKHLDNYHLEPCESQAARHDLNASTVCLANLMPLAQRTASAFTQTFEYLDWLDNDTPAFWAYFNMELAKVLILRGEMAPILRACAIPDNNLLSWATATDIFEQTSDGGWAKILERAIDAYICLNICYSFPQAWDTKSGRTPVQDYRNTRLYQDMLQDCTLHEFVVDSTLLPHREFFRVTDEQVEWYNNHSSSTGASTGGFISFPEFISRTRKDAKKHQYFNSGLLSSIHRNLLSRGLPDDIVQAIFSFADIDIYGRLGHVLDNPLHYDNKEELVHYLTYCWQLIIRCNMIAQQLHWDICWKDTVVKCLVRRLSSNGNRAFWNA